MGLSSQCDLQDSHQYDGMLVRVWPLDCRSGTDMPGEFLGVVWLVEAQVCSQMAFPRLEGSSLMS